MGHRCTPRRQRSGEQKWRVCKLELFEFIRRYLQHVLPHGFTPQRSADNFRRK
ncbi:MAG: transposase [Pontiellaceae bacterium]|nr:transposase [Pontiellaceae bacterium]